MCRKSLELSKKFTTKYDFAFRRVYPSIYGEIALPSKCIYSYLEINH